MAASSGRERSDDDAITRPSMRRCRKPLSKASSRAVSWPLEATMVEKPCGSTSRCMASTNRLSVGTVKSRITQASVIERRLRMLCATMSGT